MSHLRTCLEDKIYNGKEEHKEFFRMLDEAVKALEMYASLNGKPLHWPNVDRYTYLETPAIEALAKIDKRLNELT